MKKNKDLRPDVNSDKHNLIKKSIEGLWDYECVVADNMDFPYPKNCGNAHGGFCRIEIIKTDSAYEVTVRGTRIWRGVKIDGTFTNYLTLDKRVEWKEENGAIINDHELMYTYGVVGEPVHGITFITLEQNGQEALMKPKGTFYYFPNSQPITKAAYETLKARRRVRRFGEIHGTITFTNHRV